MPFTFSSSLELNDSTQKQLEQLQESCTRALDELNENNGSEDEIAALQSNCDQDIDFYNQILSRR